MCKLFKNTAKECNLNQIKVTKGNVFKFLSTETAQYDFIFADPPYDISKIPDIARLVFERNLLTENGILVVEHQSLQNLEGHPNFVEKRKYGYSTFSFFENKNSSNNI